MGALVEPSRGKWLKAREQAFQEDGTGHWSTSCGRIRPYVSAPDRMYTDTEASVERSRPLRKCWPCGFVRFPRSSRGLVLKWSARQTHTHEIEREGRVRAPDDEPPYKSEEEPVSFSRELCLDCMLNLDAWQLKQETAYSTSGEQEMGHRLSGR
jgi:hypothetical protein